jgi:hypothetical protein
MSIEAWGAIGEIVGAIAVVITLGYLTVQVRQSAAANASDAIAQAAAEHVANMRAIAQDPVLAGAWLKLRQGEPLTPLEESQFTWWTFCFVRSAETHIQMAKLGITPEFEAPWRDVLRSMAATNRIMRTTLENYIGTRAFKDWIAREVLSPGKN